LSPAPAYAPNAGRETAPARANRLPNCERQITDGVFVEKGTERYTVGTEVGRKCVMF